MSQDFEFCGHVAASELQLHCELLHNHNLHKLYFKLSSVRNLILEACVQCRGTQAHGITVASSPAILLMLLSAHVTSVLFLVQFSNFALTTGFYWSYTLL